MMRRRLRFPCWCVICFAAIFFLGAHPFLEAASDDPSVQLDDRRPWSRLRDAEKERLWTQWQDPSPRGEVADGRRFEVLNPQASADDALDFRALVSTYDSFVR